MSTGHTGNNLGLFRQIYVTVVSVFGLGNIFGWTSTSMVFLKHDFSLSKWDESWISSINHLGGLLACLIGGFALEYIGRKKSALLFTLPSILGWGLLIWANNTVMLYTARFILGFSSTFACIVSPVLVSEISEPRIRGALSIACGVFLTGGMLFSYLIGSFVEWRTLSIICSVVPIISFLLILTIKESPRHMLQNGNDFDGTTSFLWYRGISQSQFFNNKTSDYEGLIQAELDAIKDDISKTHSAQSNINIISLLSSSESLKPLIICVTLMLIEQLSGYAAIVAFTSEIFAAAGIEEEKNLMAIIFGAFQFLAAIISSLLIDRLGRRPLLIVGQILMFFSLFGLGIFLNDVKSDQRHDIDPQEFTGDDETNYKTRGAMIYRWMPLLCLVVYICMFCIGIGSIATTLMGELLPQNLRGIGSSICTAALRISAFGINFGFKSVGESLGPQWCFWSFSAVCGAGFIFIVLFVPETKGKPLEEIKALFKKQSSEGRVQE